jgi:hypothetical protein
MTEPAPGNGTQHELGRLTAETKALGLSVDVLRDEVRTGFSNVRQEIIGLASDARGEITGCRLHEATELNRLEALALANRTLATKAVVVSYWAMTIAIGGISGLATWIILHVTQGK